MTPGPDYYRLADGRQFYEYCRDEILPCCVNAGIGAWDIHCIVSAAEHYFRMDAKEGESDTDMDSYLWWLQVRDSAESNDVATKVIGMVGRERGKVGR